MRARLKGLHTASKKLATGKFCIYAYAWRGGPLLAKGEGATRALARLRLESNLGSADVLRRHADYVAKSEPKKPADQALVRGLVASFKMSPEFLNLSQSARSSYNLYLDRFVLEFGDWKVAFFNRHEVVIDLTDWRDEYARSPRSADYMVQSVKRLFSWARRRGLTGADPTRDIPRLYKCDRSEVIWSPEDVAKFSDVASTEMGLAVRLASLTGLRRGDLLSLTWSAVSEWAMVKTTKKRGKLALIPLLPETKDLLGKIPKRGPMVLTNTLGRPWTAEGFKTSFQKARAKAQLEHLRFHDLRGTAATFFAQSNLNTRDIARIVGWSERHVEELMARYVSQDRLALDMISRMKQKPPLTNQ